jgi:UDP-glucose 4-epimerase
MKEHDHVSRVLVTGGAGYIGSQTVKELLAKGYEPVTLDDFSEGHRGAVPGGIVREGNLHDAAFVRRVLREDSIDAVFHFAASCLVGESVTDPAKYYRNNLGASIVLLDAMRDAGVTKMIFSSTCATYGDPIEIPMTERHPQSPVNPYGESKLAFERVLRDYAAAYGMRAVSLRYFNAAGADPSGDLGEDHHPETHLIPIVLAAALGKRAGVDVFGDDYATPDGSCIRDYIHIVDLALAHILALERLDTMPSFSAYNLGTGTGYSVFEVIRAAERVTKRTIPHRVAARRAGDPAVLVAGAGRVASELGWSPQHSSLEEILESAWAWHRAHPNGYERPE